MTWLGVGVRVSFPALGTTAVVVVADRGAGADAALAAVEGQISLVDAACSRFREDSELSLLNASGGATIAASPVLLDALEVAVRRRRVDRRPGRPECRKRHSGSWL